MKQRLINKADLIEKIEILYDINGKYKREV